MKNSVKISLSIKFGFFSALLLLFSCIDSVYSQNLKTEDELVYSIVEVMPTFPGGANELERYLFEQTELNDPKYRDHEQIKYTVSFIIKKDGLIFKPVIERQNIDDPKLAKHTLEIVRLMPKWSPGEQGGVKVGVKNYLNIKYRYVEQDKDVKPVNYFLNIASEKEALKDYVGACTIYNNVLKIDSGNVIALQKRSILKEIYLKDFPGALADYNKLIKAFPERSSYYLRRGYVEQELLQDKNAIADYTKAIVLDPENADAYYKRGQLKYFNKMKTEACEDFIKAEQLGSEEASMALATFCK